VYRTTTVAPRVIRARMFYTARPCSRPTSRSQSFNYRST